MDYKRNRTYFAGSKLFVTGVVLAVFCFLFITSQEGVAPKIIGWLLTLGGIALAVWVKRKLLIYSDIDDCANAEVHNVKDLALEKLGIDEDQVSVAPPIVVSWYYVDPDDETTLYKKGKDKKWRSSSYITMVFFFSQDSLYSFTYKFSLIKNAPHYETQQFFYRDVVSVLVSQSKDNVIVAIVKNKDKKDLTPTMPVTESIEQIHFSLTAAGGYSFEVALESSNDINRSINAMRNLIMDKKQTLV
ncbi:hypothetical protein FACS1894188_08180 [Clostridia bacterium]|nr:hypothetical protein FACS1894188_08180 [Clostridia bacterium]